MVRVRVRFRVMVRVRDRVRDITSYYAGMSFAETVREGEGCVLGNRKGLCSRTGRVCVREQEGSVFENRKGVCWERSRVAWEGC